MLALPETLRTSVRLLRTHPVISIALGAAIVLSLCATCTGLGLMFGPWFVCELYGVQLAVASGVARTRSRAWLGAGLLVLLTVLVVALTGWLSALGFGPDVATADAADEPLPWPEALRRVGLIAGSTTLAVGFIAPFVYAPLVLIDRGGRIGGAVIESAYLVFRTGLVRHLFLAFAIYALQLSPALVTAMLVARTFERAATPLGLFAALPLMAISIPLGQGLLTAAYLARSARLAAPRTVRARGAPPRALAALLAFVSLAPLAALLMLGLTALRPSTPAPSYAPAGTTLLDRAIDGARGPAEVAVPDTTLRVHVDGADLAILAGEQAGAGPLPRRWSAPIERVRVVRARDVYAVEVHAGDRVFHTRVDAAGGRVDDSIRRRLEEHVPTWALYAILASFAACGVLLLRALAPLGALRAVTDEDADARRRARDDAHHRSLRHGLLLAPFALLSLIAGLVSIGWLRW